MCLPMTLAEPVPPKKGSHGPLVAAIEPRWVLLPLHDQNGAMASNMALGSALVLANGGDQLLRRGEAASLQRFREI